MTYGVFLLTENNQPFVTPQSTPLRRVARLTANSTSGSAVTSASVSLTVTNPNIPIVPVCYATTSGVKTVGFSHTISGNVITFRGLCYDTSDLRGFTMTVDVYSSQPRDSAGIDYGFAIFNEQGKVILTNEDVVLTDIVTIGTRGVTADSGMNINTTLAGKYGIIPGYPGGRYYVLPNSPAAIAIGHAFACGYDGTNTRINNQTTATSTAGTPQGAYNRAVPAFAVKIVN